MVAILVALLAAAAGAQLGRAADGGDPVTTQAPAPSASASEAKQKGKARRKGRLRVKVKIRTPSQRRLLARQRLRVRVRASGRGRKRPRRGRVRLTARQGEAKRLVKPRKLRFRRPGARLVSLRLTRRGRAVLGACGEQRVVVRGKFRLKLRGRKDARGKGKRPRRRRTARHRRTLRQGRCEPIEAESPERCDPIDTAACLAPYPNDHFTVADRSTDTGRRLDLKPESLPASGAGEPIFSPEYNRNDGFSPNNPIVTRIPGIETQAAFDANDLVPQTDIGAFADPGQRVVLIDAKTGERQPIWAELDRIPDRDDDRLLIIHPAVALDYGTRYIVALRDLTDAAGRPLEPNRVFRAYRDRIGTENEALEARRPRMENVFGTLRAAGIARDALYLAWDFTVASEENLTGRLLAMRDDAFAQLGDSNLADGVVDGDPPQVNDLEATDFALCDSDGTPECELDVPAGDPPQSNYVGRRVTGTITVPCYMDAPGAASNQVDPDIPCAAGSRLHFEGDAELPSQNRGATWEAPFTCVLPRTGAGAGGLATAMPGIVFGHGLLQNHRVVEQLGLFPASLDAVSCGTDWIGLSAIDSITGEVLPGGDLTFLANLVTDLSKFPAIPDRSQQGYVNALYLARAMAHPQGLADEPELAGAGGEPALDPGRELGYLGISLGGIFGGATTAVAPDWERAVLGVPGMGFTTLLTRSTQFNQFLPAIYAAYPDPLERQLGISVLQALWDRGEPSAYVHRLTDQPLPSTPRHRVMIQEAFGDHQVANVQTEALARTLGATLRRPTLAPGRSLDAEPFWGIDTAPSADFNLPGGLAGDPPASLFVIDTGPIRVEDADNDGADEVVGTNPNPISNVAPVDATGLDPSRWNDGLDPHEPSATSPAAQALIVPFLRGEGTFDPCLAPAPSHPFDPPYAGAPQPCTAPPIHTLGEGR